MKPVKVLIVEDSLVFRSLLADNLRKDPEIEVVATARDPFEARDMIIEHNPDVMTLDIEMPRMTGIEFLKKLMPQHPMPVVMISSLSEKVFDAMQAGAVDFVAKPNTCNRMELKDFIQKELPEKVKTAAKAQITGKRHVISSDIVNMDSQSTGPVKNKDIVIAIGASTGGTEATAQVLQGFDKDVPGIVIVQHMPKGFTEMYAKRLDQQSRIAVREAKTGDMIQPGLALLAPGGDAHMEVVKMNGGYQVVIKKAPKVNGHCPSVEVLFNSVAKNVGKNALGIILTGMGGDGAEGLLAMRQKGARTIGQDESTCVVYGMPRVAYEIGAVEYQEKLMDIARRTYQILHKM